MKVYTVNITDDRGDHHGWTLGGCESRSDAIRKVTRVFKVDNPGRARASCEVWLSTGDGRQLGAISKRGAE